MLKIIPFLVPLIFGIIIFSIIQQVIRMNKAQEPYVGAANNMLKIFRGNKKKRSRLSNLKD
tara:strand:+ start:35452 stop:35634 length:183 start_codon:yes stop_codon:yes gene_type:complete